MTSQTSAQADMPDPLRPIVDRRNVTAILWQGAALMLALTVLCLGAWAIDERTLRDVSVWSKPIKFNLSLAVYWVTLALVIPLVAATIYQRMWFRFVVGAGLVAGLGEIAWITFQAARGRASHFNLDTPLEAFGYQMMGLGALTLVGVSAIIGLLVLIRPAPVLSRALRLGAGWGLVLGSVFTLIIAGYLANQPDHLVVPGSSDAGGMPLTGWSRQTGDLRVPHFFATHMMQALPLAAYVATRWVPDRSVLITAAVGIGWTVLTFATLIQALRGMPFA